MRQTYFVGEGWSNEDGSQSMWFAMPRGNKDANQVWWFDSKAEAQNFADQSNGVEN